MNVGLQSIHKKKGFSLIEILVVLVVIAFATKMVVYSL
ncbi:type II secretion system protein, partial [Pseudoalteromonas sp. ESRF-bin5]